jgi:RNA polymerase sigma-70 factor (ECF subfamily)
MESRFWGSESVCVSVMSLSNPGLAADVGDSMDRSDNLERNAALNQFLSEIERRAYRIALLSCGSREDAHDIVQDAMLKLLQSYGHRPREEWPLLFHRILQNRIRDWHRRAGVRNQLTRWFSGNTEQAEDDPLEQLPARAAFEPLNQYTTDERIQRLERSLERLPLRQKQVFLLRIWEGMSVEDTARVLGCSTGSVKTHLFRATNKLREELGDVS